MPSDMQVKRVEYPKKLQGANPIPHQNVRARKDTLTRRNMDNKIKSKPRKDHQIKHTKVESVDSLRGSD